jgi:hypothetical protein
MTWGSLLAIHAYERVRAPDASVGRSIASFADGNARSDGSLSAAMIRQCVGAEEAIVVAPSRSASAQIAANDPCGGCTGTPIGAGQEPPSKMPDPS